MVVRVAVAEENGHQSITPSPFKLLCHNTYEVVRVATDKTQATGGKPPEGPCRKKTNKQTNNNKQKPLLPGQQPTESSVL